MIDESWLKLYSPELQARLKELLDDPKGYLECADSCRMDLGVEVLYCASRSLRAGIDGGDAKRFM
jgi:hypothetical protein